eukprot:TRINITY_DN2846_c0_g4_i3.p1 TRINITY_DN2846_c0_g4~~TRINITY_DN2846_c0_g4_i3.p1  ORF type:complete len:636 (-),score=108.04 TRINITY_DN2846_c0_g4_i3:350-2257(-)
MVALLIGMMSWCLVDRVVAGPGAVAKEYVAVADKLMDQDFQKLSIPPYPVERSGFLSRAQLAHAATSVYSNLLAGTGYAQDLVEEEIEQFKARFVSYFVEQVEALQLGTRSGPARQYLWFQEAVKSFKMMRPVVSKSEVERINSLDLGWRAKYDDHVMGVSVRDYETMLGKKTASNGFPGSMQDRGDVRVVTTDDSIPADFDSREKWPLCAATIGSIHNQGHCGSCWAFGALSAVDSRLCIATNGAWNSQRGLLSRGYTTSCATTNGCGGGTSAYALDLISREGVPTGGHAGCIPYFADGEGTEHFQQSSQAPECPAQCREGYARPLKADLIRIDGLAPYVEVWNFGGVNNVRAKLAILHEGPIPFGIYAANPFMSYESGIYSQFPCSMLPNHEVVAIGWGSTPENHFVGLNSWGPRWGDGGQFKIADCAPTDFTFPGTIELSSSFIPDELVQTQKGAGVAFTKDKRCACRSKWIQAGMEDKPCWTSCCNPDEDPKGAWCFVADAACQGSSYGYCDVTQRELVQQEWKVLEGHCTFADGCIVSPNFPNAYDVGERCVIDVGEGNTRAMQAKAVNTEKWCDTLKVNGEVFSGSEFPSSIVPTGHIIWESDRSTVGKGWKLCMVSSKQDDVVAINHV